ncbi:sugar-binding protein [Thalassotalea atypica]|uniref:sugar-binding protein n=1 Tax=Thalassotalea atypica TaxID=2054316 RepID=UPI003D9B1E69
MCTTSKVTVAATSKKSASLLNVERSSAPIKIDGQLAESAWNSADWRDINHHILGEMPTEKDFSGRYKLLWDTSYLYIAAEITDDILFDQHADPLIKYWDDDCLEVFVDEDNSGGDHQFNFNAFAYHIALDNQVVDIGKLDERKAPTFLLLNDHVNSQWRRQQTPPYQMVWEVAVTLYDDSYELGSNDNHPVELKRGKKIGFMLAYCDNDGSTEREHFVGSTAITPINGDKNLGYKTADVFDTIFLVDKVGSQPK